MATSGRLPIGFILVRLEDPKSQQHALDLTLTAQEGPRWAKAIKVAPQNVYPIEEAPGIVVEAADPIYVERGDRVLVKQHTGYDVQLVLPDTPETMRCDLCGAPQDDPETPPACLRNPDVREGYGPHLFVPKATPEALLIVNLADLLYCEPA